MPSGITSSDEKMKPFVEKAPDEVHELASGDIYPKFSLRKNTFKYTKIGHLPARIALITARRKIVSK